MATSIQNFYSIASQKQFSRDFFMRVKQISLPGLQFNGLNELVYARTARLPGRTIEDKTVNYAGQVFHLNGRATYDNSESYSIEFYMDQYLDLRSKLERASRAAFDGNGPIISGQFCMPTDADYMILDVLQAPCGVGSAFPNTGDSPVLPLQSIKFVGVSIRAIQPVEYQIADGTGEIQKLTCTFSYHWYEEILPTGI